jgi:hypothetical protein
MLLVGALTTAVEPFDLPSVSDLISKFFLEASSTTGSIFFDSTEG